MKRKTFLLWLTAVCLLFAVQGWGGTAVQVLAADGQAAGVLAGEGA